MINRRALLTGAAAVAVAPTAATALPARVLDKVPPLPPSLPGFIPCDGRELPIADYRALARAIYGERADDPMAFAFRVPDLRGRARVFDQQGLLARPDDSLPVMMQIATGEDERVPAGVVMPMVVRNV